MNASLVSLELDEGVALLRLQDDDHKNTLHPELVRELTRILVLVSKLTEVHACVLLGLPEVFCAGASKDMLEDLATGRISTTDILLTRAVIDVPVPTIAAMRGHAIGGGLVLGLACDMVLLSRESRYGCPFMNMGFTPGMGSTRLLDEALGGALSNELMYGGESMKGRRFEGCPGISGVLPRNVVEDRAFALARRVAEKPRTSLELLKRTLSLRKRQAFEEARTVESMMHQICFAQPDIQDRIQNDYVGPRELNPAKSRSVIDAS